MSYKGNRKPVSMSGYEGFEFHGIRQTSPDTSEGVDKRVWCVYESTTGLAGAWGSTLEEASTWTRFFLDQWGGPDFLLSRGASRVGQEALF